MSAHRADLPPVYQLKTQASGVGILDPRAALLLWGAGSIIAGLTVTLLLVQGEIRILVLLALSVLALVSLSPRRGVYVLLTFLPFMYFIRRLVLNFQEFNQRDPILLFPAVTTVLMFIGTLVFYGPTVFHYFQRSSILKACALLMAVFVLQVFNPHQGSPLVGLAGGMFLIVPMSWCIFGLLLERDDMVRIFKIVITIGFITALYGLYQHYWGLSAVELYELKSKNFLKYVGGKENIRVMSTFASLGDFSLYLAVASFLAFAWFWRRKVNFFLVGIVLVNLYAMLWLAVRTSFLLVMFSIIILLIIYGRSVPKILFRGAMAFLLIAVCYGVLYRYEPRKMYDQRFSANPYVVHTLSGISHPTQESTFQARLQNWSSIVSSTVFQYPAGRGLGSTTTAARKFEGGESFTTDSYFFELFYGSGVAAPALFIFIAYGFLRRTLGLCLDVPDQFIYKMCLALIAALFLGSVFGLAIRDTITGPLAWLIIGWIIKEQVDHTLARQTS